MIGHRRAGQPKRQPCREHMSVHAILRCVRCAAIFWTAQDALKALDQKRKGALT